MAARREKVTLVLDDNFSSGILRARRAIVTLNRRMEQNAHPLDRVDPEAPAPQRWQGDDS